MFDENAAKGRSSGLTIEGDFISDLVQLGRDVACKVSLIDCRHIGLHVDCPFLAVIQLSPNQSLSPANGARVTSMLRYLGRWQ